MIAELPPSSPSLIEKLEHEADRIAEFAAERRGLLKVSREDAFIRALRIGDVMEEAPLDEEVLRILHRTVEWCGLDFACIFRLVSKKCNGRRGPVNASGCELTGV
jgi:hypothetical protein